MRRRGEGRISVAAVQDKGHAELGRGGEGRLSVAVVQDEGMSPEHGV